MAPHLRNLAASGLGHRERLLAVIDVEAIDSKRSHGERAGLPAAGWSGNNNHPRSGQRASPRLERRVRVWQHIGRQVARYELAVSVHDAEPFEPRSRAREPHCSELREAPTPFHAVLLAIEIEVVETRFGDRCCARGCGHEVSMPDMPAPSKAERSGRSPKRGRQKLKSPVFTGPFRVARARNSTFLPSNFKALRRCGCRSTRRL